MRFHEHQILEFKGSTLKMSKDDLEHPFKKVEIYKHRSRKDAKAKKG